MMFYAVYDQMVYPAHLKLTDTEVCPVFLPFLLDLEHC